MIAQENAHQPTPEETPARLPSRRETYIVSLDLDVSGVGPGRTREKVKSELSRGVNEFTARLNQFLNDNNLADQVQRVNPLYNIGMVILECSPRIAELVKGLDGVRDVTESQERRILPLPGKPQ